MSLNKQYVVMYESEDCLDTICETLEDALQECKRCAGEQGFAEVYQLTWKAAFVTTEVRVDEEGNVIQGEE